MDIYIHRAIALVEACEPGPCSHAQVLLKESGFLQVIISYVPGACFMGGMLATVAGSSHHLPSIGFTVFAHTVTGRAIFSNLYLRALYIGPDQGD